MTKTIGNPLSWSAKEIGVVGQHLGSVAGHIGHGDAPEVEMPAIRRISVHDLRDVLREGAEDFGACRTDVAFLFGVLWHIFKNNWQDDKYIHDRVYGMDKVKEDVMAKWTPDKVEEVTGVPEAQIYKVAEMMAKNRPSTLVWCMGQTQHSIGNAFVRASCIVRSRRRPGSSPTTPASRAR